jgi:uncharacterized protein YndB with AHSA1/START domain
MSEERSVATVAEPVRRVVAAPAEAVWKVLADGWSYSSWVVGTARIRSVDPSWPGEGSRIHHSFGTWPFLIDDHTMVLSAEPERSLELRARGWPAGEAQVRIEIRPSGDHCEVLITEDAVSGPGALVPPVVRQPLITLRNRETIRRLAMLAQGRAATAQG